MFNTPHRLIASMSDGPEPVRLRGRGGLVPRTHRVRAALLDPPGPRSSGGTLEMCRYSVRLATTSIREATMLTSDPVQILQDIRTYLLEGFSQVTIAPLADAKTGSALINILQARRRWAVEISDTFLDANSSLPHPLDAIRKWDLIGMLRSAESGSIVRVTTTGLRFI